MVESSAVASIFRKRAARVSFGAQVVCTTRRISVGAKSFSRFAGAREVWVGRLVRDSSARAAYGFEPLVGTEHTSAVARADVAAVQDVLHRQVDVDALGFARDLDAVAECGDRSVGPAASAVLRHMLIPVLGGVADAIDVSPVERLGELFCTKELLVRLFIVDGDIEKSSP